MHIPMSHPMQCNVYCWCYGWRSVQPEHKCRELDCTKKPLEQDTSEANLQCPVYCRHYTTARHGICIYVAVSQMCAHASVQQLGDKDPPRHDVMKPMYLGSPNAQRVASNLPQRIMCTGVWQTTICPLVVPSTGFCLLTAASISMTSCTASLPPIL